jgi:hypothetical protein
MGAWCFPLQKVKFKTAAQRKASAAVFGWDKFADML